MGNSAASNRVAVLHGVMRGTVATGERLMVVRLTYVCRSEACKGGFV